MRTVPTLSRWGAPLLAACVAACGQSTEDRARDVFAVAPGVEVDTASVAGAIARDLPLGTTRDSVLRLMASRGIGRLPHTSSDWFRPDSVLVVRVDYDPDRLDLVQASYGVGLTFDRARRLTAVEVHRALTGL